MKNGFLKVAALTPKTVVADPTANAEICAEAAREAAEGGSRVIVFPELTLTTAGLCDLFLHKALTDAAESALECYIEKTKDISAVSFIGLPVVSSGLIYNAAAVVCRGRLVGVTAASCASYPFKEAPEELSYVTLAGQKTLFGRDIIFESFDGKIRIAAEIGDDIRAVLPPSCIAAESGANLIVNLASEPEYMGAASRRRRLVVAHSERIIAAYVYCSAGVSESGGDSVSSGHSIVAECGELVCERTPFERDALYAVIDTEKSEFLRKRDAFGGSLTHECVEFELCEEDTELSPFNKYPFIPEEECELRVALDIQAEALAARFIRAHSKTLVIGISGGLDSTLALLVCRRAVDVIARDNAGITPEIITAVTMPCFGTTRRTRSNAERLSEALGASLKRIDIKAAVTQHFKDIGHCEDDFSVVYENAQARERTQVLMDIANGEGGLVVGTGDLSEVALGWSTYNGDHMSMYGVNASVPKTLVRRLVSYYAERFAEGEVRDILGDILATPVSPELLPPTSDGEISQRTEGIVGPYELHDFFLYWFIKYGFSPEKLLRMAEVSFADEYDFEVVRSWLAVFVRRFITQQFKRSCMPDGPLVSEISLSPRGAFNMPSDASFSAWLQNLERNK